jgi:hypothetical protein
VASHGKGSRIRHIEAWFLSSHGLTSAAFLRVALSLFVIARITSLFGLREILWGANAHVPLEAAATFGVPEGLLPALATLHDGPLTFFLSCGLALALCYGCGIATRITGPLLFGFVFVIWRRNPFLLDGGDGAALLALFLCLFLQTNRRLAWEITPFARPRQLAWIGSQLRRSRVPVIIHNFALLALCLQLCLIYFTTGVAKVAGEPWQQGVALHYALSVNSFSLAPLGPAFLRHPLALVLMNYVVLLEELSYPFLVWNRSLRIWVLGASCLLHIGVALTMGLFGFSFVMIALQSSFLDDSQWRRVATRVRQLVRLPSSLRPLVRKAGPGPEPSTERITRVLEP